MFSVHVGLLDTCIRLASRRPSAKCKRAGLRFKVPSVQQQRWRRLRSQRLSSRLVQWPPQGLSKHGLGCERHKESSVWCAIGAHAAFIARADRVVCLVRKRFSGFSTFVTLQRDAVAACIGNPKPEQETIKGTHTQETPAYQRRPTTQYAAQGSNPPIGRCTCS